MKNNNETRVNITDTILDVLFKMSDGNPGAITAMMELLKADHVDPDNLMKGLGHLLSLDSLNIYGTNIYILWSDICNRDIVKMIAVLRANQLGYIDSVLLRSACSRQDRSGCKLIDVEDLYKQVCDYLPNFDKENRNG